MRLKLWVCVLAVASGLGTAEAASCKSLSTLRLPDTKITLAQEVASGAFVSPIPFPGPPGPSPYANLPAFCRVAGTIAPTPDSIINFEVWMPSKGWNGKFVGVGNGVWAGAISYFEMAPALARGYATAATDDGHQGSPMDASFIAGHPENLIDFGHRAVHEMTVKAKPVIAAFYGKSPSRSLFASCSTGGRQGLMEAYRYPEDYDAISALAPANPMTKLMIGSLWTGYVALKDEASRIPPAKFAVIHKAAVESCDADDGVTDGIIGAPESCKFDPKVLKCKGKDAPDCLTKAQVKTLQAIYAGPKNPRTGEAIYPGFSPGSEALLVALTQQPFGAATTYLRSVVSSDPNWDFKSFDYDVDTARVIEVGGGVMDVPPEGVEAYLKAVTSFSCRTAGRTASSRP